jgi:tripartite ATP-independent transporter DctP family solute receptor
MDNSLDIATCANSVMTNFIPEMGILDQAYLWKNADEAHAAVDGALGDLIKEAAEAQGLHVIGFLESGFRNTFSTKPIQSIEDFTGVTIRTMENKYHMAAFESFGAMPIAMSYNEVFTALQQGTIDACENATSNCLNSGYYEVTKNVTNSQHAFVYILMCMSDDAWNKIPEDLREPFLAAVQEGVEYERNLLNEANAAATEELKKLGVSFYDIDIPTLQAAYQAKAAEKGFTFDPAWQAAVDEAVASVG